MSYLSLHFWENYEESEISNILSFKSWKIKEEVTLYVKKNVSSLFFFK